MLREAIPLREALSLAFSSPTRDRVILVLPLCLPWSLGATCTIALLALRVLRIRHAQTSDSGKHHRQQGSGTAADAMQRNFQPFTGHKGLRKELLGQKLAFVQDLISGRGVVVEQKELFDVRSLGELHHIFPGTMAPALLALLQLIPAILGIVDQDIDPAHRL